MTEPNRAQAAPASDTPAADENKIIAERREKLAALRQQGVAFPNDFRPTHQPPRCMSSLARPTSPRWKRSRSKWPSPAA